MSLYTIIRIYQVPADTQSQATDRMAEAIDLKQEKYYHVKDIIRKSGQSEDQGKTVDLRPPTGWLALIKEQLGLS